MEKWVLEILRCPVSGERLQVASADLVHLLQTRQKDGQDVTNEIGLSIDAPIEAGLVNESQTYFHVIRNEIPTLIPGEAIRIDGLQSSHASVGQ